MYRPISNSDANLFNGTWNDYYAGIFRCNTLLQKLDQIDWKGDDEIRKRVEGETRALRAIMYFDLARLFGSVPLLTGPTAENLPQAEPAEIYKLILSPLSSKFNTLKLRLARYLFSPLIASSMTSLAMTPGSSVTIGSASFLLL